MKSFAALINLLEQTNKDHERILILRDFFLENDDEDKIWALALLGGFKLKSKIKASDLKLWALEISEIDQWLYEESLLVSGDVLETISLMLPNSKAAAEFKFSACIQLIQSLDELNQEEKKHIIISVWNRLTGFERFIFNKLITGTFKLSIKQKVICKALAGFTDLYETTLAHRLSGEWSPLTSTFNQLVIEAGEYDNISKPYPFLVPKLLVENSELFSNSEEWLVEWKWEGIRAQIIKRNMRLFIWNFEGELITDRFPEFAALQEFLPEGIVIDGMIIAYENDRPLPFQKLQTRIKSKTVTTKLLKEVPVVFMAFDLLELENVDCRNLPLIMRRTKLQMLLEKDGGFPALILSEELTYASLEELDELRIKSRTLFCDGLIFKKRNAPYDVSKSNWWKWKPDLIRIKTVLLYAQATQGGKAGIYEEFTFAVWEKEALVPVAKARIGLNDEDLFEIEAFVQKNTIEKFGPVRSVKPELVFELELESVLPSTRHKSGIIIQHPKIYLRRKDLNIIDVGTLEEVKALVAG